ncbi:phage holin family protein [Kitasatospora aureofaciens]|uniref:phage holin family protein n=1 Tax=Kitasatospora aureofaciens TaxID=1894 RepID=UPI0009323BDE|nr:phage holin family protein [Streptomyces viridifaciens]UKZ09977.1 phage holin family protein [Streptomyces viridifaciens]
MQLTEPVRDELCLAQAENEGEGQALRQGRRPVRRRRVVGFLTAQALVATVTAALAVALPVRAAGPIVTAALGVITATPVMSEKQVDRAGPPAPERTVENVKADMAEMKGSAHR